MSEDAKDFVKVLADIQKHGMDDESYSNLIASLETRTDDETHMLIAYVQRLRKQTESNMQVIDKVASGMYGERETQQEAHQEIIQWSTRKWR